MALTAQERQNLVLHCLGWTLDAISLKLQAICPDAIGTSRETVTDILGEMQKSTFLPKIDLEKGHAPAEIAKRHALPEILVWTLTSQPDFWFENFGGKEGWGVISAGVFPGQKRVE